MNNWEMQRIRQFISSHASETQIDDDEDLFANGHVNSLFAVQLVMWVERTFDIAAGNTDLDIANFRTISAIASFVERKRAVAERPADAAVGGETWTSD
jgi:acyl carrier protein